MIDLLGAVAYGELSAIERLSADSKMAPSLEDKTAILGMAAAQHAAIPPVLDRLRSLGTDPFESMEPLRDAVDGFHAHTAPSDWYESLVKAYVGDGLVDDFFREIAEFLDEDTRGLVRTTLEDGGHADFVVERVRAAIQEDHQVAGRLALWGRRIMGEAFAEAQQVAASREGLSELLAGGHLPGFDLGKVNEIFGRIRERHVERMGRLGLEH